MSPNSVVSGRGNTITRRLSQLAEERPHDTFAVDLSATAPGRSTMTFAELVDRSGRMAVVLSQAGVQHGEAVHVQLPNSLDYLTCLFGIARLGAVLVPTNPSAKSDDIAYVASHAGCRVSIVAGRELAAVSAAQEMTPEIATVITTNGWGADSIDLGQALDAADDPAPPDRSSESELAAVLYTSGTTGFPKGVMITHGNLMFAGEAVAAHARIRPDDRWLVSLPMSHMNALGYSTMSALSAGASVALVDGFDPVTWPDAAQRSYATLCSLFAVHVRKLLISMPGRVATSLRTLLFAQHLSASERDRINRLIGATPLQVYGLTETIAPTIADSPFVPHRPDTMGRLTLWAEARVIDSSGNVLPDGVAGELVVRGQPGRTLMSGYLARDEDTERALCGGWLRTGDRMVRDRDGFYRFLGRSAEVIKPDADNVSALEIERVLREHVSVSDAAVVGAHSEGGDESIVAFVVLVPNDDAAPEEIIDWAGERLAAYKMPHHVVFIDHLPRNPVGKVDRRDLVRLATDALEGAGGRDG